MANFFDHTIISFINQFCGKSQVFDRTVVFLTDNDLFKGCVIMALFWWEWYKPSENMAIKRERIISAIYGCCVAMFVVRVITKFSHFRTRPILNPANHLTTAIGFDVSRIPDTHNSFPSDHGTLFFALATGLWFVSRRMGIFSFMYVALFIAFPRVYVGLHYPTDILGGALIGMIVVAIYNIPYFRSKISGKLLSYSETHPAAFYTTFFVLSMQIVTLFSDSRGFLHFLGTLLKLK
jgi:undecaprenyl-diphosphatase